MIQQREGRLAFCLVPWMRCVAIVIGVCALSAGVEPQRLANPLVGRWELDVARSHYGGGAEPRRQESFICETVHDAVQCTTTSVRPDGRRVVATFTARDDGTPAWATISRHLSVLKDAGLITAERNGNSISYELNATVLQEVIEHLMDWTRPGGKHA